MNKETLSHERRAKKAIIEAANITFNTGLLLYNPNITPDELSVLSLTLTDLAHACHEAAEALRLIDEVGKINEVL